jgi:hypothetical protein
VAKKKKPPFQRKTRTREHIIADLAVNHIERHILLRGFTLERITQDYGVDLVLFTYNLKGEPEEGVVYIQVKATEKVNLVEGGTAVSFRLDRTDLQIWLAQPMPVILCVYDVAGDVAYWLYVQRYFESQPGFNLFALGATVSVRLPVSQVVDTNAVGTFAQFLAEVQQQIYGKISHV